MSEAKTRTTDQAVSEFLAGITDVQQRQDCQAIMQVMSEITGAEPQMWGTSIVGFGSYHYRYTTGREGDAPLTGFSPRKQNLTLYLAYGFEQHAELMNQLGRYKTGKACLYIKRLTDVDPLVLRNLIQYAVEQVLRMNGPASVT